MRRLVWSRDPVETNRKLTAVQGQYRIRKDPGAHYCVLHRSPGSETLELSEWCDIGETNTLDNAQALAQAHADRDRTEISTDAQAPALAAKPRRYIPSLTLLHSQALDVWAVTLADTNLGDDDDDDTSAIYFFSTKELAERYINMMSPVDDDDDYDDDDDEPVARADVKVAWSSGRTASWLASAEWREWWSGDRSLWSGQPFQSIRSHPHDKQDRNRTVATDHAAGAPVRSQTMAD